MSEMFEEEGSCNPDISLWDVSIVTSFVSTKTILVSSLFQLLSIFLLLYSNSFIFDFYSYCIFKSMSL